MITCSCEIEDEKVKLLLLGLCYKGLLLNNVEKITFVRQNKFRALLTPQHGFISLVETDSAADSAIQEIELSFISEIKTPYLVEQINHHRHTFINLSPRLSFNNTFDFFGNLYLWSIKSDSLLPQKED